VKRLAQSLYYEDIEVGRAFETRAHEVSDDDLQRFADLTHDHHALHRDDAFARSMGFPRRIAHGLFGLALMEGLKSELGLYETTSVASIGWDEVRFRKAIVSGERVHVRVRLASMRPTRKPGRGVVTEEVELINQDGEVVISASHATLLIMRGAASSKPDPSSAPALSALGTVASS
jgi:acyl dehydratase